MRPRPWRVAARPLLLVLMLGLLVSPAPLAAQTTCLPPAPSATQPGYLVADPRCDFPAGTPFAPLTGPDGAPISLVFAAVVDGAAFRIEVPLRWNGDLVVWAHGFRGTGTTVWVDNSPLRAHHVQQGFAWAASSYETNGYDVGQGVRDSHELLAIFRSVTGERPRDVYMTGMSMGGHITAVAIEHHRRSFDAAMPMCGVLGDKELFDYFTDANVTAAALAGARIEFPLEPAEDFPARFEEQALGFLPRLGTFAPGTIPTLTEAGRRWSAAVERRSGGERPGFDSAFAFWSSLSFAPLTRVPFLIGLYPGTTGGTINIADGNVVDNRFTIYQLDDSRRLSGEELRLNLRALRVAPTTRASRELDGIPAVEGDPRMPVLSLHNLGDLFVPFSMEQLYAERVARHGQARLFVSRAIRANGHCDFTPAELTRAFDDLVRWERAGERPAGDAILDRAAVASPAFGCRFTTAARPSFVAPACP